MAYMLLILETEENRRNRPLDTGRVAYDRMLAFGRSLSERGVLIASDALRADATRLEIRHGKAVVQDGPFAEAKEMVGGFFLLDCATKAEAMSLARDCPAAEWAIVEVREVGMCWEDSPQVS